MLYHAYNIHIHDCFDYMATLVINSLSKYLFSAQDIEFSNAFSGIMFLLIHQFRDKIYWVHFTVKKYNSIF